MSFTTFWLIANIGAIAKSGHALARPEAFELFQKYQVNNAYQQFANAGPETPLVRKARAV